MLDLNKIVAETMKNIQEEKVVEKLVEEKIKSTLKDVINDLFGNWSPFSKQIKKELEKKLNINFENLDVAEYNALIALTVKNKLDEILTGQAVEKTKVLIDEMLADVKPEYNLSEIIEKFIDDIDKEDLDYEEYQDITLIIEDSDSFKYIYLDESEDVAKYRCKYRIAIYDEKIFSINIENKELDHKKVLGGLYGFEALLFKLYANKTSLVFDQGMKSENYETSYTNNYED